MSQLDSNHLTIFGRNSHLTVLRKSIQNTLVTINLMGLKDSIYFTVTSSKSYITINYQFNKYATSLFNAFSITAS